MGRAPRTTPGRPRAARCTASRESAAESRPAVSAAAGQAGPGQSGHKFGRAGTIGVEEELLLLDAETFAPVAAVEEVVPERTERLKTELFACIVETTTEICEAPEEALA